MSQLQERFLFQPTSVPGCQLWLDAADVNGNGLSPVNDSSVSIWVDKSGNGRSVSQGTLLNQPTNLNIRGINYINFTSANTNFLSNTSMNIDYRTSQIFLVFQRKSVQSNNGLFCPLANANSGADWTNTNEFVITTPTEVASAGSGTSDGQSGNLNLTTYQFVINNNSLTTFRDFGGTSVITRNMGLTTSPTALYIGRRRDGVSLLPANILFGEALVYNKLLSVNENQQIQGYLAWKWGLVANLPSNHPFKTYRPLAQTPIPTSIPPMPLSFNNQTVFLPTQISGCQLWLDAADTTTTSLSSSSVTQWRDKSQNLNHFSSAGVSTSPTTGTFNGLRTIYWTNTNQQLVSSQNNATSGNASRTMFVLQYNPLVTSQLYLVTGNESGANPATAWGYGKNPNADYSYPFLYSAIGADVFTFVQIRNIPTILATTFNGSSVTGWINSQYEITRSTALNTTPGVWYLGRRQQAATGSVDSYFLEIIQYNFALTTAQRQQVEGYLAWKWGFASGLPNGHPYKQQQIAPFRFTPVPIVSLNNTSFSPLAIAGCQLWLDAADTNTISLSGSTVTQWRDKSGNNNNTNAVTGAPQYQGNGVYFNGSAAMFGPISNTTNVMSSFLVGTVNNSTALDGRILSFSVQGQADFQANTRVIPFFRFGTSAAISSYRNPSNASAIAISYDTSFLAGTFFNGTNCLFFINGSQGGTIASSTGNFSYSRYGLAQDAGGVDGQRLVGFIYEVISFNASLTTSQRQNIEGYLAWKWGLQGSLPANHPFKLFPPAPL